MITGTDMLELNAIRIKIDPQVWPQQISKVFHQKLLKILMLCASLFKGPLHEWFEAALTAKSCGHRKTQR